MTDDDAELPFTVFVAAAQLLVGIGLIAFATSSAVRIIGVVVIAFALLTGGSAWYHARRRGQHLFRWVGEVGGEELGGEDLEAEDLGEALGAPEPVDQSSQGPRQPPNPEVRRSAPSGPQEPGA